MADLNNSNKTGDNQAYKEVVGTPSLLLLPSRNYKFRVYDTQYSIRIPRKGHYSDFIEMGEGLEGDFSILTYDDKEKINILYLPTIQKVMYATKQYPALKDNQALVVVALVISEEFVDVICNLIDMLED